MRLQKKKKKEKKDWSKEGVVYGERSSRLLDRNKYAVCSHVERV